MEWYYILLIILACLIVIALIVLVCCRNYEYQYSSSSGDFGRNGYATTTSTRSEGEYERYHSGTQPLASTMPLPPSEFAKSEYRTEVISSYPPKPPPKGFGYSTPTAQYVEQLSQTSNNRAPHQVSNGSQQTTTYTASCPPSTQTPYPAGMEISQTSHHLHSNRTPYPPESQRHDTRSSNTASYTLEAPQYKDDPSRSTPKAKETREVQYRTSSSSYAAPYLTSTRTPYPSELQRNDAPHHSISYHQTNINSTPYPTTRTMYPPEPYANGTSSSHFAPSPPARTVSFALTRKTQSTGELPPSFSEVVYREPSRSGMRKQLSETSIYDNV